MTTFKRLISCLRDTIKPTGKRSVYNIHFAISYSEALKLLEIHPLEQAISMILAALIFASSQIQPLHLQIYSCIHETS
jgi:hypothetical protein